MLMHTLAGNLKTDPRIVEAKQLMLKAIAEHQKAITGIRPPNPDLAAPYKEACEKLSRERGFNLWYPYIGSGIGKGALVELLDGSVKYDFIGGIGVHQLGHSHHDLISAGIDGAISDTVMQGNLQQNGDSADLMDLLVKESGMDHCFLTTSGSMANENGLKIAFQKHAPANRVLAFDKAFAGRTLAMACVTDKPAFRVGLPTGIAVDYIPFYDPEQPEESTRESVAKLEQLLSRYPGQYAAMILELIQGEGGFYPGSTSFFKAIINTLKRHHVAVMVDEVQTFGRTSRLFAFQHFGLEEEVDIVSIGKLSQVCATLFRHEYKPKPGLLSQTFTSSSAAISAAKMVIHILLRDGCFGEEGFNMRVNAHFSENFNKIARKHPKLLKGPYGIGAMVAFTPLEGETEQAKRFVNKLYDHGVIGFIAGADPARVRFLVPAGAIEEHEIDRVCEIVEETLLCM